MARNEMKQDWRVRAIGPQNTTLHIRLILAARVFHSEVAKALRENSVFRALEYKKLVTTDGYNETWTTTYGQE